MIKIKGRTSLTNSIETSMTVDAVMEKMKLSGERYISILNGIPVTGDRIVNPSDELLFLEIFSGG
ncbi:MAG: hypothetical protein M1460_04190 [Candidatus Thermoplasmatota archaeon]|jgi:sulfur carrier protein ThiS|nr:hypothetical protein [Candidatus Thermoplasmatota archaeon]MCL5987476.1 hypothetical protein [Candidatus Thermoplasmatota archaeon]